MFHPTYNLYFYFFLNDLTGFWGFGVLDWKVDTNNQRKI